MNLPNTITLGRIFLVPLLVVVLLTNPKEFLVFGVSKEIAGALIFAVASITDWLDGYLARRRGQITGLGQWMDPLADKLLVIASLISLVYLDLAKAWMVAVIIGREFYVTVIRSMAHARGQSLPASPLGKIKLIAQVAAILILLLSHGRLQGLFFVGMVALWIATIAAILSAIDYTRKINVLMATKMTEAPALNQNAGPAETPAGKPQAVAKPTAAAGEGRKRISA